MRRCATCGNRKPVAAFTRPGSNLCRRCHAKGAPSEAARGRALPRPVELVKVIFAEERVALEKQYYKADVEAGA